MKNNNNRYIIYIIIQYIIPVYIINDYINITNKQL